jgi:cathepsin X
VYDYIQKNGATDETCAIYQARGWTNGKTCTELSECYTTTPKDGNLAESDYLIPATYRKWYVTETFTIKQDSVDDIIQALQDGPISCAINAAPIENYTGGIITSNVTNDPDDLDHAISIVGYGTENGVDYWLVRNSWGTAWGEQGFFRVGRGANYLGIELDCTCATINAEPEMVNSKKTEDTQKLRAYNDVVDTTKSHTAEKGCRVPKINWEKEIIDYPRPHEIYAPEVLPKNFTW